MATSWSSSVAGGLLIVLVTVFFFTLFTSSVDSDVVAAVTVAGILFLFLLPGGLPNFRSIVNEIIRIKLQTNYAKPEEAIFVM